MENQEKTTTFYPRTDLAIEISQQLRLNQDKSYQIPGVEIYEKLFYEKIKVTRVSVINDEGVKNMGKPKGSYITLESSALKQNDPDTHAEIIDLLSQAIHELLPKVENERALNVLVIGLGNRFATPDTLGPKVANKVLVTRHIAVKAPEAIDESVCHLSSLAPGVMGLTGIETAEIIKGVAEKIKPDCIIAIDALAARSASRINTTIQISDTGISPGAGVGNARKALNEETLGCKVIAIGVPTVVDTGTLLSDTMKKLIEGMLKKAEHSKLFDMLATLNEADCYQMVCETVPELSELFVTPKEIDELIEYLTSIIANSINIAVHPGITIEDINKYTY